MYIDLTPEQRQLRDVRELARAREREAERARPRDRAPRGPREAVGQSSEGHRVGVCPRAAQTKQDRTRHLLY